VSNFNNSTNTQGTGTTIVTVTPGQNPSTAPVFFNSQAAGLTEALGVLKSGFVIAGNVPTTDGTFGTIGPGSLQIIDRFGHVVQTLSDASTNSNLFDGPWASAVNDHGKTAQVFVSDVEGGTVTRINLKVTKKHGQASLKVVSMTQIASGYLVQPNPAAVIVGPGGLAYNPKNDTLYVAATANNEIFAISHASKTHSDSGMGTLVYQDQTHLRGPIGLALAPNGDLLTTNDDAVNFDLNQPSELIEFSTAGQFIGELSLDRAPGAAFQLVVQSTRHTVTIVTVNDDVFTLDFRTITT
jgi:DNA-binding beta-propeller fold protein YncE